jgi:hypothetical protein
MMHLMLASDKRVFKSLQDLTNIFMSKFIVYYAMYQERSQFNCCCLSANEVKVLFSDKQKSLVENKILIIQ